MKSKMKKLKAILTALLALCLSPIIHGFGETEFKETEVLTRRTLTKEKSPYLFKHDVLIRPEGELIIEPGVELRFAPEAGITVRGILNADGTPEQKIKFVSSFIRTVKPAAAVKKNAMALRDAIAAEAEEMHMHAHAAPSTAIDETTEDAAG